VTAISIEPGTGRKIFNTRAAKASERIQGKGYGVVSDSSLTTLPEYKAGAVFNAEEQAKYREYKEARRGAADYMPMEGEFAKYLEDHYSAPPVEREALTDECDIVVVGAGFAGLLLWYKLSQAGFDDVRFCERGGDVGGTWYWNRYPGIACDVESFSYSYSFSPEIEQDWTWSHRYALQPEILAYANFVADRLDLKRDISFGTRVNAARLRRAEPPLAHHHRHVRPFRRAVPDHGDGLPVGAEGSGPARAARFRRRCAAHRRLAAGGI